MPASRRQFVGRAGALAAAAGVGGTARPAAGEADEPGRSPATAPGRSFRAPAGPRYRLISDNDYSGDPDGLFQLAHHLLSPSVELRAVIGSHLAPGDPFDSSDRTATNAARRAQTVIGLVRRRGGAVPVLEGSNAALADPGTPRRSAGAEAIVREAMRSDSTLPLFVTFGAGLTELASAYLIEPRIADRLTAVWIGGPEHPDLGPHPERPGADSGPEYNLNIDLAAAQVVFNESTIPVWQVPRNVYRQCLVSMDELAGRVRPLGRLGAHLYDAIFAVFELASSAGLNLGETYILGDNPLVLLTALQSSFQANTSSSRYVVVDAPRIDGDGSYSPRSGGRPIRVYTELDLRLMFDDLYAKLALHAGRRGQSR
jgi:hypothetical protein